MEKHLWIRLGVTLLNITDAEEAALFGDDECKARDVIERMIAENRFHLDGETLCTQRDDRGLQPRVWNDPRG